MLRFCRCYQTVFLKRVVISLFPCQLCVRVPLALRLFHLRHSPRCVIIATKIYLCTTFVTNVVEYLHMFVNHLYKLSMECLLQPFTHLTMFAFSFVGIYLYVYTHTHTYIHGRSFNNLAFNSVHLFVDFFFSKSQFALCMRGFCIHRFHPLWIKSSIFNPQLGICGCKGLTIYIVLHHFV